MLIVAQPKSASTSLLYSIAKAAGIKAVNGKSKSKNDELCIGFEELQKYHTTTHKRTEKLLTYYCQKKDLIYKDHILPTEEHLKYLNKKRFIVLLRKPEDTIDNYKRIIENYKNNKLLAKDAKELKLELLINIDFDKFCDDIRLFNKIWSEYHGGLHIDYDTLIMCPRNTLLKCMNYFQLPIIGKIELVKAKGNHGYNTYTGIGEKRAKERWNDTNC